MMIDDEQNFKNTRSQKLVSENDNLLKICFDFCDIEEILFLSLASKKFNKITKDLDYKFEEAIEKKYFSNYSNYE